MKIRFILTALLLPFFLVAQKLVPCDCSIVHERADYITYQEGQKLVDDYLAKIYWLSNKIKKKDKKKIQNIEKLEILVRRAACENAHAELCAGGTRLILFNDCFVKLINSEDKSMTSIDKHILIHEIGHHVLKHVQDKKTFEALTEINKYDPALDIQKIDKVLRDYNIKNPQIREYEADFFALWLMKKLDPNFDFDSDVKEKLNLNIKLVSGCNRRVKLEVLDEEMAYFKVRIKAMEIFWDGLKNTPNSGKWLNYIGEYAESFYLNQRTEKSFWDLSLSSNLVLKGSPVFYSYKTQTPTFVYPTSAYINGGLGLSLNRFSWDKPVRFGVDLGYSTIKFGSYSITENEKKSLVESFKFQYFNFMPKIERYLLRFPKENIYASTKFGLFASLGLGMQVPIKTKYENYVSIASSPKATIGISPKLSVGLDWTKRSLLAKSFRLTFDYEFHHIRMSNIPPDSYAYSHNFSVGVQYAFRRWLGK